jgi:hypothetical protein
MYASGGLASLLAPIEPRLHGAVGATLLLSDNDQEG